LQYRTVVQPVPNAVYRLDFYD